MEILDSPLSIPIHEVLSLFLVSPPSSTTSSSDIYISVPASTSVININANPMHPSQPSMPTSSASGNIFSRETLTMSWNKRPRSNDKYKVYKRMKEKQDEPHHGKIKFINDTST